MKAGDKREAWVADRVKEGIDVMNPRLVQTGLDLIDFQTLWGTRRITARQGVAAVVAHRADPGEGGVHVLPNTLQADALKLVAKKLHPCRCRGTGWPTATTGTT